MTDKNISNLDMANKTPDASEAELNELTELQARLSALVSPEIAMAIGDLLMLHVFRITAEFVRTFPKSYKKARSKHRSRLMRTLAKLEKGEK